jgi:RimJ/RimL family protein N-acetyltransferase
MHIFPVETDRLQMRPLALGDEALYCCLYGDTETMRFIGAPLSPERAAKSFRSALLGMNRSPIEQLLLIVAEKASRQDVGLCCLQNYDAQHRSVQAGIMFVASVRAQGYSKEGMSGLIQQAFAQLPVDEVSVQITTGHVFAEKSATSMGFIRRRETAAADGAQLCTWSARRESWLTKPSAK